MKCKDKKVQEALFLIQGRSSNPAEREALDVIVQYIEALESANRMYRLVTDVQRRSLGKIAVDEVPLI